MQDAYFQAPGRDPLLAKATRSTVVSLITRLRPIALDGKVNNMERHVMSSGDPLKRGYLQEIHIFAQQIRKLHEIDGTYYVQSFLAHLKEVAVHNKANHSESYVTSSDYLLKQQMREIHEIDDMLILSVGQEIVPIPRAEVSQKAVQETRISRFTMRSRLNEGSAPGR